MSEAPPGADTTPLRPAPQRWGIVGLGSQADAIASALSTAPGVQLAGCASSTPVRAKQFGAAHGCRAHQDETELVQAGYDVVVVAGPNSRHADVAIAALEGGSAVLCEKPMTLTVPDAQRVLDTAAATRRPLFVGYHLRFQGLGTDIRRMVASGRLGAVRDIAMQRYSEQVTVNVRPWRHDLDQAGAGVLCDVAVHLFDYVSWVTGLAVESVGAVAVPARSTGRPDEHVVVTLELEGDALAVVDAARSLPVGENALHLHGTEASLCTGPLRWVETIGAELRSQSGTSETLQAPAGKPLAAELLAVRDAAGGEGPGILATAMDGFRGVATLEAAIESLHSGRRCIPAAPDTAADGTVHPGQPVHTGQARDAAGPNRSEEAW